MHGSRRGLLLMLSPDSRANLARCQAEAPLIALCRFPKPALCEIIRLDPILLNPLITNRNRRTLGDGWRDGYRVVTVLRGPSKTFQQPLAVLDVDEEALRLSLPERDNASTAILPKPAVVRGVRVSDPPPRWTGATVRASKDPQTWTIVLAARRDASGSQRSVFEIVVIEGRARARPLWRRRTLQELRGVPLARLARFARRALGRIAADLRLQLYDVEEDVGLAAQLGGNHRRLRRDGGDHGHAHAAPLHRLDQRAEVAVAREQHHVVDRPCDFHGIDRELDVHVALDLAPAGLIDEFLGRLGHDAVAIVVEPVDQRPDRRIFLVLDHGGVIEGAQEIAARLKLAQETLVVDIETERLGGGGEIGAVNEQGHFFRFGFHNCSRVRSSKLRYRRTSRMAEICLDRKSEGFHSPESAQHPAFYMYRESYPRRNGSPRNCCSRAGDERNAVPVSV